MASSFLQSGFGARIARVGAIAIAAALTGTFLLNVASPQPASAQAKKDAKAADPKAAGKTDSAWVRVCHDRDLKGKDKEGKDVEKKLDICQTTTQQIHPISGAVRVGITIQHAKMDGKEEQSLLAVVPEGVVLPNGAAITIVPKDLWQKMVQKKEKLSDAETKKLDESTVKLVYTYCMRLNCFAEGKITPKIVEQMTASEGLLLQAVLPGAAVVEPVSLQGFRQALTNPPTDPQKLAAAHAALAKQIEENRKQYIAEYKKKQEELSKMQPNVGASKAPAAPPKK